MNYDDFVGVPRLRDLSPERQAYWKNARERSIAAVEASPEHAQLMDEERKNHAVSSCVVVKCDVCRWIANHPIAKEGSK